MYMAVQQGSTHSGSIHVEYWVDNMDYYTDWFSWNSPNADTVQQTTSNIAMGCYIDDCHYMAVADNAEMNQ